MRRSRQPVRIGIAYASYVAEFVQRWGRHVDYVEIPFERLRSDSNAACMVDRFPTIMHCASLSVAGVLPASDAIVEEVSSWSRAMNTPWIGEHLAFVTAPDANGGVPLSVGYTVAPPLDGATLDRVSHAVTRYEAAIGRPLLLENPPQYFATPGSTMEQPAFLVALCRASDVGLLLDLSHFLITASNAGFNAFRAIEQLPLERVREIHLSGVRIEAGVAWDDHGTVAPPEVFELLAIALSRATPAAITLEYNWPGAFPEETILADVERVRAITLGGSK
jgi:uncharacterized protein (UPF0276 family)